MERVEVFDDEARGLRAIVAPLEVERAYVVVVLQGPSHRDVVRSSWSIGADRCTTVPLGMSATDFARRSPRLVASVEIGTVLRELVRQLLAAVGRFAADQQPVQANWLGEARDLLRTRTPAPLSLGELAAAVGVHPVHLARSFRREFGMTVSQYSRALRLDWAAAQLAGEAPLARIALEAGFADQSHFTRAFRGYTGMTPGRYRKLLRA